MEQSHLRLEWRISCQTFQRNFHWHFNRNVFPHKSVRRQFRIFEECIRIPYIYLVQIIRVSKWLCPTWKYYIHMSLKRARQKLCLVAAEGTQHTLAQNHINFPEDTNYYLWIIYTVCVEGCLLCSMCNVTPTKCTKMPQFNGYIADG